MIPFAELHRLDLNDSFFPGTWAEFFCLFEPRSQSKHHSRLTTAPPTTAASLAITTPTRLILTRYPNIVHRTSITTVFTRLCHSPSVLPLPAASPSSLRRFPPHPKVPHRHASRASPKLQRFSHPPPRSSLLPHAHVLLLLLSRDSSPRRPLVTTPRPRFPSQALPLRSVLMDNLWTRRTK